MAGLGPEDILNAMLDPVHITNRDFEIEFANRACTETFGPCPPGTKCYAYFHGFDSPCAWCRHQEVMEGDSYRTENYFERKSRYFDANHSPLRKPDGEIVKLVILRDITLVRDVYRQQSEQYLTEMRLKALLRLSQMSDKNMQEIMDFGLEEALRLTASKIGYIYYYDAHAELFTLYSWSSQVMAQCSVMEKRTSYELRRTGLWGEAVRQRRPIVTNDYAAPNPYKKGIPEGHVSLTRHLNIPVFMDGSIVAVVGVGNKESDYTAGDILQLQLFMDGLWSIVEKRRMEEELRRSEEKLHDAQIEGMRKLIAGLSHEIRNPLFGISSIGQILQRDITDARYAPMISALTMESARIASLINELNMYVRPKTPAPSSVDTEAFLQKALGDVPQRYHGVALRVSVASPLTIRVDESLLGYAIGQLVDNSCQAHATEIAVDVRPSGTGAAFTIRDNGRGMTEQEMVRCCDPFFTTKTGTTGLGLSLSRKIIEMHGGSFGIESSPGAGTTVVFSI